MIFSERTSYLCAQQRDALLDMSLRLDTDADALRGMLAVLERKGRVRKLPKGTRCSTRCSGCEVESIEIYEWVEAREREPGGPTTQIRPITR